MVITSIPTKYQEMLEKIRASNEKLTDRFKGVLSVNHELDRTLVSYQANKNANGHRWCKYKEGFSASLMQYIFNKTGIRSGSILDPFAGSGTALFMASEMGLDSVGIEILPSSIEIIEAKTTIYNSDKEKLSKELHRFCDGKSWEKTGPEKSFTHLRITESAFPKETEKKLGRFLYEIEKNVDPNLSPVLRFAALCILESISYTRKDGQYLRWDLRSGRTTSSKPFDKGQILEFSFAITEKINQIITDILGDDLLFEFPKGNGNIKILEGSCLDILSSIENCAFNGIITSPPYCNRYDYTRTYALELAMLGVTEDQLKTLRQRMLTCTVENREKVGLEKTISRVQYESALAAFSSQKTLNHILDYLDLCRKDGVLNNTGVPRMVRNYFKEMALVIFECARILNRNSPLVMVNDNVRYQGATIPVDLILSDFAQQAGFAIEAIWVLPKGKGNSSQQMGLHGREELRKCVYIWRKIKDL